MTVPASLRALFLLGLAGLAILFLRGESDEARGELRVATGDLGELADALLAAGPPERIRWTGDAAPDGRALWLLSPTPITPPLTLPVGEVPGLVVTPPIRPVAGRNAALTVALRIPDGDSSWVYWSDALGALDSLLLRSDGTELVEAGLRVNPSSSGWQRWRVRVGAGSPGGTGSGREGDARVDANTAEVGVWVRPAAPLRVLVAGGTPDWESRFALRALEGSGINVDARFDLGRVSVGGGLPGDMSGYDVALVMGELSLSTAAQDRLREFVERGGGVIVAPSLATARASTNTAMSALLGSWGVADSIQMGTLRQNESPMWSLPPELSPLPPASGIMRTVVLPQEGSTSINPATLVAARGPEGEVLATMTQVGRGRVGFTGLSESWRWRMEAGDLESHQAWWRNWVHWAAGGLRDPLIVSLPNSTVPIGGRVDLMFTAMEPDSEFPREVRLERPGGVVEVLPVVAAPSTEPGGPGRAIEDGAPATSEDGTNATSSFLASAVGDYRVYWPGGETGIRADSVGPMPDPGTRSLAALASGSPGTPGLPLTELGRSTGAAGLPPWSGGARPWPLWLGALFALLLAVEWTLRRLRGGP